MALTRGQKLKQVQDKAEELNRKLHQEFHNDPTYKTQINGGHLFSGKYYAAETRRMYISMNPGTSQEPGPEPFLTRLEKEEWYWGNTGQPWVDDYTHFQNANSFFHSEPTLESWMAASEFTSTYLVSWRTPESCSLTPNPVLEQRVRSYSGEIIRLMFEHCLPSLLVVSGVGTLRSLHRKEWLNCTYTETGRFQDSDGKPHELHQCTKGRLHHPLYGDILTFMVPHFSWANSEPLRAKCASWLRDELVSSGYMT